MYEWSKGLRDAYVDESHGIVNMGGSNSQNETENHVVTVRGKLGEASVLVTHSLYHATSVSASGGWIRDILDCFVADKATPLDAVLRKRSGFSTLLNALGMGKGVCPVSHPLFKTSKLSVETNEAAASYIFDATYCDLALQVFATTPCRWVEYQEGAGISGYFGLSAKNLTPQHIDSALHQVLALTSQAQSLVP